MDNNSNKEREKIITFILGALLIIVVLAIIAIFSGNQPGAASVYF